MTSFEHCLSINESDWTFGLATENNLLVFESRNALDPVFISTGSERSFHACARVRVVLNSEARRESVRATGADESANSRVPSRSRCHRARSTRQQRATKPVRADR
jgi:hypothetical protein